VLVFFRPAQLPAGQAIGFVVVIVGVFANAASSILGRQVNRSLTISPAVVTVVSMGIGAIFLLVAGITVQGFPSLSLANWAIILWLAAVNSAFAFTLWNHTLRTLSAMESSIINNTMLIQIPILAWIFLGEALTGNEIAGLIFAAIGILIVQLYSRQSK
jgi:drug/metabolite transporter (DMT)-like permease